MVLRNSLGSRHMEFIVKMSTNNWIGTFVLLSIFFIYLGDIDLRVILVRTT